MKIIMIMLMLILFESSTALSQNADVLIEKGYTKAAHVSETMIPKPLYLNNTEVAMIKESI